MLSNKITKEARLRGIYSKLFAFFKGRNQALCASSILVTGIFYDGQQVLRKCMLNECSFRLFGSWWVPCHWLNKSGRGYFTARRGTRVVLVIFFSPSLLFPFTLYSPSFIWFLREDSWLFSPFIGSRLPLHHLDSHEMMWCSPVWLSVCFWPLQVQHMITSSLLSMTNKYDLVIVGLRFFYSLWREVVFKKNCFFGGFAIHLFF